MTNMIPIIPRNATRDQYERMMTNWKDLNEVGQKYVTESTWDKIKDGEESIFGPIEEAEDSVIDGVVSFVHSTEGIVVMICCLAVLIILCALCSFCKTCMHECGVRKQLNSIRRGNSGSQENPSNLVNEMLTTSKV